MAFDLDGDGHAELVSGWANGKVRADVSLCVSVWVWWERMKGVRVWVGGHMARHACCMYQHPPTAQTNTQSDKHKPIHPTRWSVDVPMLVRWLCVTTCQQQLLHLFFCLNKKNRVNLHNKVHRVLCMKVLVEDTHLIYHTSQLPTNTHTYIHTHTLTHHSALGKITQQPSVQRGMASRVAAVAVDGEVRGYAPNAQQQQSEAAALTVQLEDLKKVKQELLYELHAYEYCNTIGMGWVGVFCG